MSKSKKQQISQKEMVRLRERELSNGNKSLYLDIYRNGKREREFLKLYLIKEKDAVDREKNRQTLATARAIQSDRQIKLQNGEYDFTRQYSPETPFLPYYRKMCEDRLGSPGNWGNRRSCLKFLEMYCDENTTFKDIDKEWIEGFKDFLEHVAKDTHKRSRSTESDLFVGLSQNSKVSYFNKLRACINDAFNKGIIPRNPLVGVEGFKTADVEREYLTLDELQKLIDTPCKYPWLRATFLFSCFTGLRKSDIERLKWGDVVKFGDYDRIIFKQKKTLQQEYLDINPQAREFMGERGGFNDLVFPGFSYSAWTLLELRRWILAAGITKDLTFHCARHTFAVMMLTVGADIYTVSKLLGHKNLSTTQIYAKVVDKKKQDAINMIPQFHKPPTEGEKDKKKK